MVQVAGPAYCKVYPVCTLHPRAAKVPGLQCTVPSLPFPAHLGLYNPHTEETVSSAVDVL